MRAILPFIVILLCLFTFYQAMIPGIPLDDYAGIWVNEDSEGSITTLVITVNDSQVELQAFGNCDPLECEWGRVNGTPYSSGIGAPAWANTDAVEAEFHLEPGTPNHITHKLTVAPAGDYHLQVQNTTTYKDGSGRNERMTTFRFRKGGP